MEKCILLVHCKLCLIQDCIWAVLHGEITLCVPSMRPHLNDQEVRIILYKKEVDLCPTIGNDTIITQQPENISSSVTDTTFFSGEDVSASSEASNSYLFVGGMFLGGLVGMGICLAIIWNIFRWYRRQMRRSISQRSRRIVDGQAVLPHGHQRRIPPPRPPPLRKVEEFEMDVFKTSTNPFLESPEEINKSMEDIETPFAVQFESHSKVSSNFLGLSKDILVPQEAKTRVALNIAEEATFEEVLLTPFGSPVSSEDQNSLLMSHVTYV